MELRGVRMACSGHNSKHSIRVGELNKQRVVMYSTSVLPRGETGPHKNLAYRGRATGDLLTRFHNDDSLDCVY